MNPRPASYKDAALTAELRASASRAGGNRTHTVRIKSPPCCLLHHDPVSRGVCVCSDASFVCSFRSQSRSVVALGIAPSAPWLSAEVGQLALDYRVVFKQLVWESNPSLRLERAESWTDRRTSRVVGRRGRAQWAGRRSNPRLRLFRPLLDRLSYRPALSGQEKSPMSL